MHHLGQGHHEAKVAQIALTVEDQVILLAIALNREENVHGPLFVLTVGKRDIYLVIVLNLGVIRDLEGDEVLQEAHMAIVATIGEDRPHMRNQGDIGVQVGIEKIADIGIDIEVQDEAEAEAEVQVVEDIAIVLLILHMILIEDIRHLEGRIHLVVVLRIAVTLPEALPHGDMLHLHDFHLHLPDLHQEDLLNGTDHHLAADHQREEWTEECSRASLFLLERKIAAIILQAPAGELIIHRGMESQKTQTDSKTTLLVRADRTNDIKCQSEQCEVFKINLQNLFHFTKITYFL